MCPTSERAARSQTGEFNRVLENYTQKFGLYPVGNEESMKGFKQESGQTCFTKFSDSMGGSNSQWERQL